MEMHILQIMSSGTYNSFKIRRIKILNIKQIGPPVFFTGGVGYELIGEWPIGKMRQNKNPKQHRKGHSWG